MITTKDYNRLSSNESVSAEGSKSSEIEKQLCDLENEIAFLHDLCHQLVSNLTPVLLPKKEPESGSTVGQGMPMLSPLGMRLYKTRDLISMTSKLVRDTTNSVAL